MRRSVFNTISIVLVLLIAIPMYGRKKPLDHSVYDSWQSIRNINIPYNGRYVIYYVTPQEGDGTLVLYNTQSDVKTEIARGNGAVVSEDGQRLIFRISPLYSQTRQAKIDKKKGDDMPQDSLGVMDLKTLEIRKYPNIKTLKYSGNIGEYIAFQQIDTAKKKAPKDAALPLQVLNLKTYTIDTVAKADEYRFNREGELLVYITKPGKKDTLASKEMHLYRPGTKEDRIVLSTDKKAVIHLPVFDKQNSKMVFYAQTDTAKKQKQFVDIFLYDILSGNTAKPIITQKTSGMPDKWKIAEKASIEFNEAGTSLMFGTIPIPKEEDTTVVEFEKVKLDIWRWDADYLPTFEKINKSTLEKQSYLAIYNFSDTSRFVQEADEQVPSINFTDRLVGNEVVVFNDKPYRIQSQWEGMSWGGVGSCVDIVKVNIATAQKQIIKEKVYATLLSSSSDGAYYTWWDNDDKNWFLYETATGALSSLTAGLPSIFWDDENDTPSKPSPYGQAIWYDDDSYLMIGSKYDVWRFDPKGVKKPEMMTEGKGEETSTTFRPITRKMYTGSDNSRNGIAMDYAIEPKSALYFSSFNKVTKETGIYFKDYSKKKPVLTKLAEGPFTYNLSAVTSSYEYPGIAKGKNVRPRRKLSVPTILYLKGNFEHPNDVYVTKDMFRSETQLSAINPQQAEYNWGTVELFKWTTADGINAEGLLYKPEDFDSTKKYPVIIYFYEKDANDLYKYKSPAPNYSTVNIPYFVSNDYIIFDPNIYYVDGHPGQSAMHSIMPAVDKLCEWSWIDKDNMAIQGQSWGGYQVAYMVTQTDRFKAAGAGAPVSNMTSAYGGIRWSTGVTRQMQYEGGQSRIGKDLWDGFDLYIENSPLFFVPKVTTPILIMHNDKDGAVPWYQGIEYFTALRRCGKQAWLLQYNDEQHNLSKRYNAKDLAVRMGEFFDHFLKGAPMPEWMK